LSGYIDGCHKHGVLGHGKYHLISLYLQSRWNLKDLTGLDGNDLTLRNSWNFKLRFFVQKKKTASTLVGNYRSSMLGKICIRKSKTTFPWLQKLWKIGHLRFLNQI